MRPRTKSSNFFSLLNGHISHLTKSAVRLYSPLMAVSGYLVHFAKARAISNIETTGEWSPIGLILFSVIIIKIKNPKYFGHFYLMH